MEGRQDHDSRPVLVVVEDGDIQLLLEPLFDFETPGGRDIFKVYATEAGGYVFIVVMMSSMSVQFRQIG